MNAAFRFLIPPCAFVAFAFLGSRGEPVGGDSETPQENGSRGKVVSLASMQDPLEVKAALSRLERNVSPAKTEPVEIIDAMSMDAVLDEYAASSGIGSGYPVYQIATTWADEAPEAMFEWLVRQDATYNGRGLLQASILFSRWSGNHMEAALAAIPKISDQRIRAQALASTLENLYPKDPDRALKILADNLDLFPPGSDDSPFGNHGILSTTFDMLLSLPHSPQRTHLLAGQLSQLAGSSADGERKATDAWSTFSETQQRELVGEGFFGRTEVGFKGLPEMVREHAEASGDSGTAARFVDFHGDKWAESDLPAAFGWTQAHLKGRQRVEKGAGLFGAAASRDFGGTLAAWKELPEGYLKAKALSAIQRGAPAGREPELKSIIESLPE